MAANGTFGGAARMDTAGKPLYIPETAAAQAARIATAVGPSLAKQTSPPAI